MKFEAPTAGIVLHITAGRYHVVHQALAN